MKLSKLLVYILTVVSMIISVILICVISGFTTGEVEVISPHTAVYFIEAGKPMALYSLAAIFIFAINILLRYIIAPIKSTIRRVIYNFLYWIQGIFSIFACIFSIVGKAGEKLYIIEGHKLFQFVVLLFMVISPLLAVLIHNLKSTNIRRSTTN